MYDDEFSPRLGYVSARDIEALHVSSSGPNFVDLDLSAVEIPVTILRLIPVEVAREHVVIPIAMDGERICIAVCNDFALHLYDKLRFMTNHEVHPIVAPKQAILAAIDRNYGGSPK
jgi:type IV pilus assembly protein PilB